jgi:hypothetical protein
MKRFLTCFWIISAGAWIACSIALFVGCTGLPASYIFYYPGSWLICITVAPPIILAAALYVLRKTLVFLHAFVDAFFHRLDGPT